MLLVVDIGNTNTNLGVFDGDNLIKTYSISSDNIKTSDEYGILISSLLKYDGIDKNIEASCVSSVVPTIDENIKKGLVDFLKIKPYCISHKSKMPVKIGLDEPKEAGADRLSNASAVAIMYKLPAIVIDIGTATTFDVIDKNKTFIGGIIAPGPLIQAKSLSRFTSKLPKLKIEAPKSIIGKNTIDAMLSGIVLGHLKMIEGMIDLFEAELDSKATIIGTGGFSNVLFDSAKRRADYIEKNLTLFGAKILWEMNNG